MKRTLVLLVTAAAVAGSALAGSAVARDRGDRSDRMDRMDRMDRSDGAQRSDLTAQQLAAESDVRTARLKAELRLTAEQEKNWPGIASALHDLGQSRAERQVAFRAERAQQRDRDDVIAWLNRSAGFLSERSAEMKKLADAAQPFYASLDEQQQKQLFTALIRVSRGRDN